MNCTRGKSFLRTWRGIEHDLTPMSNPSSPFSLSRYKDKKVGASYQTTLQFCNDESFCDQEVDYQVALEDEGDANGWFSNNAKGHPRIAFPELVTTTSGFGVIHGPFSAEGWISKTFKLEIHTGLRIVARFWLAGEHTAADAAMSMQIDGKLTVKKLAVPTDDAMVNAGISGGDGFIEMGNTGDSWAVWRIGTYSFEGMNGGKTDYFSISRCASTAARTPLSVNRAWKSDGSDYTDTTQKSEGSGLSLCDAPLSANKRPTNVVFGDGYIEFSNIWRLGTPLKTDQGTHLALATTTQVIALWKPNGVEILQKTGYKTCYLAYANEYADLQAAWCGGSGVTCTTAGQASSAKSHYEVYYRRLGVAGGHSQGASRLGVCLGGAARYIRYGLQGSGKFLSSVQGAGETVKCTIAGFGVANAPPTFPVAALKQCRVGRKCVNAGAALGCPTGYARKGALGADVPGHGLGSAADRYGDEAVNAAACGAKCTATSGCKGFTWAPLDGDKGHSGKQVCSVYSVSAPKSTLAGVVKSSTQLGNMCHGGSNPMIVAGAGSNTQAACQKLCEAHSGCR